MKIALCLYGVVGSSHGKAHNKTSTDVLSLGYDKYYENIIKDNEVDIFIHSWSKEKEKEIVSLYKPTDYLIEEQEIFEIPSYIKGNSGLEPKRVQFTFSRWRSTQKVLKLKKQYENVNSFKYDLTLLTRFDIAFEQKINLSEIDPQKINVSNWYRVEYDSVSDIFNDGRGIFYLLSKKIDTNKLPRFGRGFPYDGEGILDYWAISGEKIDIFYDLYDNLNNYFKPGECPGAPFVSNHKVMLHHIKKKKELQNLNFILDPTKDHSMIRWKYFNSKV